MTPRESQIESLLEYIAKIPHIEYRGADYTWACKFKYFYADTWSTIKDMPMRFGIPSRSSIARCVVDGKDIMYKLSLSRNWKNQVDKMHDFFGMNKVREVHVDEDITIIKNLFVQVAKIYRVPTYVHQHGALGQRHGFLPLTADKIVVWDDRNKNKLLDWGLSPDRIIVGGYSERYRPIFSKLDKSVKSDVRNMLNIEKRKLILFAPYTFSNFGDGDEDKLLLGIKMIRQVIRRLVDADYTEAISGLGIVIKLHPSSKDKKLWDKWVKDEMLCSVVVIKDYDPYKLAYTADLMVVQSSTYAIDGIILGNPVAVIDTGWTTCVEEYHEDEHITVVKSVEDIIEWIQSKC